MSPLFLFLFLFTCILNENWAFHIHYHFRPSLSLASSASASPSLDLTPSTSPEAPGRALLERIDQLILSPLLTDDQSTSQPSPLLYRRKILENIHRDHERDVRWAKAASLPFEREAEDENTDKCNRIQYEYIEDATINTAIAIRTNKSTPLLHENEIELLRRACESYWNRPLDEGNETLGKSSFTYQRKGNSEAHLSDIVKYTRQFNNEISSLVNELLLNRVYPWVHEAYLSKEEDANHFQLYVYDSLFIRYNATESNIPLGNGGGGSQERNAGAGQPLHRDLGYVSVNIMLNPQHEFEGGGTFFENQLLPVVQAGIQSEEMQPLKPLGPGHALAHFSNIRHAGAATYSGVRDILVIFLAATEKKKIQATYPSRLRRVPRWECNARMKSTARSYCSECSNIQDQIKCRILHHRLAIDQLFDDGEAWHYMGMALMDYHDHLALSSGSSSCNDVLVSANLTEVPCALELAVSSLNEAVKHTPCDGRLYNNLDIASERLLEHYLNVNSVQSNSSMEQLGEKIQSAYRKSITVHSECRQMGCDVGSDYASACLNFGLHLSKLDMFLDAVNVLSRIVPPSSDSSAMHDNEMDSEAWARQRVINDATSLLAFCKRQIENPSLCH